VNNSKTIEFSPDEIRRYIEERGLELREQGNEFRGPCPVHQGEDDNFALNSETGQWFCHSQCNRGGSLPQLEMELSKLSYSEALRETCRIVGRPQPDDHRAPKVSATYRYFDEEGKLLYEVRRYEPKGFSMRRPDGAGGYISDAKGVRRVLYGLPKLKNAQEVCVVEGEKDSDSLERLGFTATTNPGGAGKWQKTYGQSLAGKDVVIFPDNDEAGRKHARQVRRLVAGIARSVIVVPVAQGKDVTDWIAAVGPAAVETIRRAIEAARIQSGDPSGLDQILTPQAKSSFSVTDSGVYYLGDDEPKQLCGPLLIRAKTRNERGSEWGRVLEWTDSDGRVHQWAMPMRALAGEAAEVRAHLLDHGLWMSPNPKLRERFIEFLQTFPVEKSVLCVSQTGWHNDAFVLPDKTFGNNAKPEIVFQSTHRHADRLTVSGTLEDWQTNIGRRCSGNSKLIMVVSIAFTGPLLGLLREECGGVHFHSRSSIGKTTAMRVAGSVIGGGPDGFVLSWSATANGMEAAAEAHNHLTLILDEIGQTDGRFLAESIYALANGVGKSRMNRNLTARHVAVWRLMILSTGEVTVGAHALAAGRKVRGGVDVRLLNLEADAGVGLGIFEELHGTSSADEFAGKLREASNAYFGTPIRAFIERLVAESGEGLEKKIRARQRELVTEWAAAQGEESRAAARFALFAIGGELAIDYGVAPWRAGEPTDAARKEFLYWRNRRGGRSADDSTMLDQVRLFIEKNGSSRFQLIGGEASETSLAESIRERAGFRHRAEDDSVEYWVFCEVFRQEVCVGFDYRAVCRALGYHLRREDAHFTVSRPLPEIGKQRVYCLRASILKQAEPELWDPDLADPDDFTL
jgi:uncharacterized protein (DUF927 family)/5S rRNA maturation endonuclease (ribonuclease M5)